jgi:hypothetical protein
VMIWIFWKWKSRPFKYGTNTFLSTSQFHLHISSLWPLTSRVESNEWDLSGFGRSNRGLFFYPWALPYVLPLSAVSIEVTP